MNIKNIKVNLNLIWLLYYIVFSSSLDILANTKLNLNNTQFIVTNKNINIADYNLIFANTYSNDISFDLPKAQDLKGHHLIIKKISTPNKLTITCREGFYNHFTKIVFTDDDKGLPYISLISDGEHWKIISILGAGHLVGWWKLDDKKDKLAIDSSGLNNHGNLINLNLNDNSVKGISDRGILFNDSSQAITVDNHASLRGMSALTLVTWVKINKKNDYSRFIDFTKNDKTNSQSIYKLLLDRREDHNLMFMVWTDKVSPKYILSDKPFPINQWVHIAAIYDGSKTLMYINGVLQKHMEKASGKLLNFKEVRQKLYIGSAPYLREGINGIMDDIRIYNFALNSEQIKLLKNKKLK